MEANMVTAANIEQILLQLSVPDNTIIQKATLQLKTAFSSPNIVAALVEVLRGSANPTVRQYAAILLRRRIVRQWKKVPPDVQLGLKKALLEGLVQETEHLVRLSSCQVIGSIAKQEFLNNRWPDLMQYLGNIVQSQNLREREVGFVLLNCICESAGEQLKPFYAELFPVFAKGLDDIESRQCAYYSIRGLTSLIQFIGSDEEAAMKCLVPKILETIQHFLRDDEDKACEAMDIFDELVEAEISLIVPFVKSLIEFCLEIVKCSDYSDAIKVKALYLVCWACRRKSKILMKTKLLTPLLSILLSLMSQSEDGDSDLDELNGAKVNAECDDEIDGSSLPSVAAQAIDLLALHLPPNKFVSQVLSMTQAMFSSSNRFERKAAYITVGVLAEGCADYIKNKHLQEALQTLSGGLYDQSTYVRNAALFSLGQFSEHLQPDISKYHGEVIPMLLNQLQIIANNEEATQNTSLTRVFYALDSFIENLEKNDILPYLPKLVETFTQFLKTDKDIHTTELVISAIGALSNAAKDAMVPYFPAIMDNLRVFLYEPCTLETSRLKAQAIDTLGTLARNIGEVHFKGVAHESVVLGIELLKESDDPDIKRCTYGLFASLSSVLKTDMKQYLQVIIPKMIDTLKSTEGMVPHYDEEPSFLLDDEDIDEDSLEDDDDAEDLAGYTYENPYIEEKEDTCNAFAEIAENAGTVFLPFVEESFNEMFLLIDFPHVNVRKASISACSRLCCSLQTALKETGAFDFSAVSVVLGKTMSSALNIINKDNDRDCVMASVDSVTEMLKGIPFKLAERQTMISPIAEVVNSIFHGKVACQQDDPEGDTGIDDDEDTQAELDAMLIEKTGDILPALCQSIGPQVFKSYFAQFLTQFVKRTRKTCEVSDRSFAVGTLAEVIQAMGETVAEFVPQLVQLYINCLADDDEEVKSNAAFGLGVLAESGKASVVPYFNNILQALFGVMNAGAQPLVMDNICGATCRMIMTDISAVPLEQVFPPLLRCLPIKEDKRENETMMTCLVLLYQHNNQVMFAHIQQLLPHLLQALVSPDSGLSQETKLGLREMLADMSRRFPDDFKTFLASQGLSDNILDSISLNT